MPRQPPPPRRVDGAELTRILHVAREERWKTLSLYWGPGMVMRSWNTDSVDAHTFFLQGKLREHLPLVAALTDLVALDLRGNQLGPHELRALASLQNLRRLNLQYNAVGDDGCKTLSLLAELRALNLFENGISDDGAALVGTLGKLSELDVRTNRIGARGATGLAKARALRTLSIGANPIGKDGLVALSDLTELCSLSAYSCEVPGDGAVSLARLTELQTLVYDGNGLGPDAAAALASLAELRSLSLGSTQLNDAECHALFPGLELLETLRLGDNSISGHGLRAIAACSRLANLDISANKIASEDAAPLADLRRLERLDATSNSIGDKGAAAIAQLSRLSRLQIAANGITARGATLIASLPKLRQLGIGDNPIGDEGARALAHITSLVDLQLSNNDISDHGFGAILEAWSTQPGSGAKERLGTSVYPGSRLPPELLSYHEDAQALLAAYRAFRTAEREGSLSRLLEFKLVVVGNAHAGKTSLLRYLLYNSPCDPSQASTVGASLEGDIDVSQWPSSTDGTRLNVWDFGGQAVYLGAHRLFMTSRCLYLLVVDTTTEQAVLDQWLLEIRHRGRESPIVVIENKCDRAAPRHRAYVESLAATGTASIVHYAALSCTPGSDLAIDKLRGALASQLASAPQLDHARTPVPASWLRVRHALRSEVQRHLAVSLASFRALCATAGSIADLAEQRALLRFLADIGAVAVPQIHEHQWNDEAFILDPNWITQAIYSILASETVQRAGGHFSRMQLRSILAPERYPDRTHRHLVDMLAGADLCIEKPNGRLLLPDALPEEPPRQRPVVDLSHGVIRRFLFDVLPRDFTPRLFATLNTRLPGDALLWRRGADLTIDDCHVRVGVNEGRRMVEVAVVGRYGAVAVMRLMHDCIEAAARHIDIVPRVHVPFSWESDDAVLLDTLIDLRNRTGDMSAVKVGDRSRTVKELLEGRQEAEKRAATIFRPSISTSRPLRTLVLVGTEWRSGHGGLSTLNRTLAVALAERGHTVICGIEAPSTKDVEEARERKVAVVDLSTLREGLTNGRFRPDIIIGHDRVTGDTAASLADLCQPPSICAYFVHTRPEDIEKYKKGTDRSRRGDMRRGQQGALVRRADIVVGVGPILASTASMRAHGTRPRPIVTELVPGLELGSALPDLPTEAYALISGRMTDDQVKGLGVALRAAQGVAVSRPIERLRLIVRGVAPEEEERLADMARNLAPDVNCELRPYTTDEEALREEVRGASVLLLPSRAEGFGLSAWEAIGMGVPVLVSARAGVADVIRGLAGDAYSTFVVDVSEDDEATGARWTKAMAHILEDRAVAFEWAAALQRDLAEKYTWEAAVNSLEQAWDLSISARPTRH